MMLKKTMSSRCARARSLQLLTKSTRAGGQQQVPAVRQVCSPPTMWSCWKRQSRKQRRPLPRHHHLPHLLLRRQSPLQWSRSHPLRLRLLHHLLLRHRNPLQWSKSHPHRRRLPHHRLRPLLNPRPWHPLRCPRPHRQQLLKPSRCMTTRWTRTMKSPWPKVTRSSISSSPAKTGGAARMLGQVPWVCSLPIM